MTSGEFPRGWQLTRMEDVAARQPYAVAIGPFGSDLKTSDYRQSGVPIVFVRDVQPNCFRPKLRQYVSEEKAKALAAHAVRSGDVVITKMGLPPCVAAVYPSTERPGIITADIIKLTVDKNVAEAKYIAHFLNTDLARSQVATITFGITRPKVTLRDFRGIRVPLPPLAEQRQITNLLDRVEELRAKRRAALVQLDGLAQAIFLEMFGEPAGNSKGWPDSKKLGDVAEIVSGVTKGRTLQGKESRVVPYLAVSNVQDQALDMSVVKSIEASEEEIRRYRLRKDDLLLTEGGDPDKLGRGTLWNDELPECIHQNHVFRVRLKTSELTPLFLSRLVGSQRGKNYFLRSAKQTTGIASINMTQLRGFPLLLPPIRLQKDFGLRAAAVEKLKAYHRKSLSDLDALFTSLQYRAFRGEL